MLFFVIAFILSLCIWILSIFFYNKSEYAKDTHMPLSVMLQDTGKLGEYCTYRDLKKLPGEKRFLFNCYLPKNDGTTTEIDLILLHSSGIYVLESKNYSGWIFGSETQKMWTQTLPKGHTSEKNHFLNPIIQNEIHIEWLKKYLSGLTEGPYFSIIVFSKRCVLKNIQISKNSAHVVIQRYDLLRTIQKMATGQMVYTSDQIALIYERLYPLTQTTNEQKNQHIQNINHKIYSEEKNFVSGQQGDSTMLSRTELVCPKCGAALVKKVATKGNRKGKAFWGCSRFPSCRYIQNIENS